MSSESENLSAAQRRRWQSGDRVRLDSLIAPGKWRALDNEVVLDLVYAEICLREEFGEISSLDDYDYLSSPQTEELRRLLELHAALVQDDTAPGSGVSRLEESEKDDGAGQINYEAPLTILKHRASGGLGDVFEAYDEELDRVVAFKRIRSDLHDQRKANARFRHEAIVTAKLEHPGVVPVYRFAKDGYSMRLVHGRTMREAIETFQVELKISRGDLGKSRFTLVLLLQSLAQVARTIAFAHDNGIVHRDIKPENIILGRYGESVVIDWGMAISRKSEVDSAAPRALDAKASVSGTFEYMSPEQASGASASPASDVFSLGAVLYCLLCGSPPYRGASIAAIAEQARRGEVAPIRIRAPWAPRSLASICMKAMRPVPSERFLTAQDFAEEIDRWISDEPPRFRRERLSDRLWRWTRRHRKVACATSVGLLLTVATLAIGIVLVREEKERTESAAKVSTEMVELASEVLAQTEPMGFSGVGLPSARPASPKTLQDLSQDALRRLNASTMKPREQARFCGALGNIYRSLGDYSAARELLENAQRLYESDPKATRREIAAVRHSMGWLEQDLGRYDDAETAFREALRLRLEEFGPDNLLVVETKFQLAWVLSANSAFREQPADPRAEELMTEVVDVRQRILGPNHRLVGITQLAHAALKVSRRKYLEAFAALGAAFSTLEKAGESWPLERGVTLYLHAAIARHSALRNYDLADENYRNSIAEAKSALGASHPIVAMLLGDYAGFLRQANREPEAETVFLEALGIGRKSLAKGHPLMVRALLDYARYHVQHKRLAEAHVIATEAYQLGRANLGDDHPLVQRARNRLSDPHGP